MALTKRYVDLELSDGSVHRVRVLLTDQVRADATARRLKWDTEDRDALKTQLFLGFAAAERAGIITCTFDEFYTGENPVCIDLQINAGDEDTNDEDPT